MGKSGRRISAKELVERFGGDAWSMGSGIADTYPDFTEETVRKKGMKLYVRERKERTDKYGSPLYYFTTIPRKMLEEFLEGFRWMRG